MDRRPVLKYISGIETKADEGSAYTVHRYLSQGNQRASGIRLFALLALLSPFEGKCCDLKRSFIYLKLRLLSPSEVLQAPYHLKKDLRGSWLDYLRVKAIGLKKNDIKSRIVKGQ